MRNRKLKLTARVCAEAQLNVADLTTVLNAVEFRVQRSTGDYQFTFHQRWPLLVVGQSGEGRVAALATDVAPHWVGGLVDWGRPRLTIDVANSFIEVGSHYVKLFENLLMWLREGPGARD